VSKVSQAVEAIPCSSYIHDLITAISTLGMAFSDMLFIGWGDQLLQKLVVGCHGDAPSHQAHVPLDSSK